MKSDCKDRDAEQAFMQELEMRSVKAFVRLYKSYHENFLIVAYTVLDNNKQAIEVVQEFFEELWSNENFLAIEGPLYRHLVQRLESFCESKRMTS